MWISIKKCVLLHYTKTYQQYQQVFYTKSKTNKFMNKLCELIEFINLFTKLSTTCV